MNKESFEINLKSGLNNITFGNSIENITAILGDAEDIENLDIDDENTIVLNYWDKGITLFFEDANKPSLSCIEISNRDTTLFDKKIFWMNEEEIIKLMKEKGYNNYEIETEVWGERRLTFDDLMVDFYFDEGQLSVVSWGTLINAL